MTSRSVKYFVFFAVLIIAVGSMAYVKRDINRKNYSTAESLVESESYEQAIQIYSELDDYKDSKEKLRDLENKTNYSKAVKLYEEGKKKEAKEIFEELGDFMDSKDYVLLCSIDDYNELQDGIIEEAKQLMAEESFFQAKEKLSVVENYKDSKKLIHVCDINIWRRCLATTVSAGTLTSVGITADGIKTAGTFKYDQDQLDSEGLISISDGGYFTVGVYKNGTAKVAGKIGWANDLDKRSVDNVVKGVAAFDYVAFLLEDGSVWGEGYDDSDVYGEKIDFKGWNNIIDIDAGYHLVAGVDKNGQIFVTGRNASAIKSEIESSAEKWKDVYRVAVGGGAGKKDGFVVGLKKNKTVVVAGNVDGGVSRAEEWKNISKISAGDYHVVGLTFDGQAVGCINTNAETNTWAAKTCCDFNKWNDIRIVEIEAGNCTTLLVDEMGNVYSCGYDHESQIPKSESWKDVIRFTDYSFIDYLNDLEQ